MIRPSNIDIENHTADFRCDEHDAYVIGLNVNSALIYDDAGNIKIFGSQLTSGAESCAQETSFPNQEDHITKHVSDLAKAKTE